MVNWTADKDQIILRGIFKFHDIKNSGPLLDYLAKEIGHGCTPKAVSHRLSNLRKTGQPLNSSNLKSSPRKTISAARAPRSPAYGRRTRAPVKKFVGSDSTSDEPNDEELVSSPATNRKRVRNSRTPKSYAESDATTDDDEEDEFTPTKKKFKAEPVDGDGLSGTPDVAARPEEDDEGVTFV